MSASADAAEAIVGSRARLEGVVGDGDAEAETEERDGDCDDGGEAAGTEEIDLGLIDASDAGATARAERACAPTVVDGDVVTVDDEVSGPVRVDGATAESGVAVDDKSTEDEEAETTAAAVAGSDADPAATAEAASIALANFDDLSRTPLPTPPVIDDRPMCVQIH